jgi:DNA-binding HxlR family transcriptional regulator
MSATDHTLRLTGVLDPRSSWDTGDRCTIARALDVVSSRSAFLILREAFYGTHRFDDFAERAGISQPTAASTLKRLTEHGLLDREDYREPGQRTRQRYRLTDKGADLLPALTALMEWGGRWLDDRGTSPLELRHRDCGERVELAFRCEAGHDVEPDELDLARRPRSRR